MRLLYSDEAVLRMRERAITVAEVEGVIANGETIREYADDRPYPSQLVLGWVAGRPLHVVYATECGAPASHRHYHLSARPGSLGR